MRFLPAVRGVWLGGIVLSVFLAVFPGRAQAVSCVALLSQQEKIVTLEWQSLLHRYGWIKKVHPPRVCVSAKKFQEIYRGHSMRSVYDRSEDVVYLRQWDLSGLRHELSHAWLERKFPGLPYPVSENLVLCMTVAELPVDAPPVDTQRLLRFLWRAPGTFCYDSSAAATALQLAPADLYALLTN